MKTILKFVFFFSLFSSPKEEYVRGHLKQTMWWWLGDDKSNSSINPPRICKFTANKWKWKVLSTWALRCVTYRQSYEFSLPTHGQRLSILCNIQNGNDSILHFVRSFAFDDGIVYVSRNRNKNSLSNSCSQQAIYSLHVVKPTIIMFQFFPEFIFIMIF